MQVVSQTKTRQARRVASDQSAMARITVLFVVVTVIAAVWSQHVDNVTQPAGSEITGEVGTIGNTWRNGEEGQDSNDSDDSADVTGTGRRGRNRVRENGEDKTRKRWKKFRNRTREDGDEIENDRSSRRQWRSRSRQYNRNVASDCRRRWCGEGHNTTGVGNVTRPSCWDVDMPNGTDVGQDHVDGEVEAGGDDMHNNRARGCRWNKRKWRKWRRGKKRNKTTLAPMSEDDDDLDLSEEVVRVTRPPCHDDDYMRNGTDVEAGGDVTRDNRGSGCRKWRKRKSRRGKKRNKTTPAPTSEDHDDDDDGDLDVSEENLPVED